MAAVQERIEGPDLILFVHGLGCAKESFKSAWESTALEGFSLLAPDLPGHGETPTEPWGCRMEDYAAFLKSVVIARRWERLHVVAHSMGGAAALLLDRFEKRDPIKLSLEHSNLELIDRMVTRIALSLIVAAMIVGLAVLIPATTDTPWLVQAIVIFSFVVALTMGGWILFSIVRKK